MSDWNLLWRHGVVRIRKALRSLEGANVYGGRRVVVVACVCALCVASGAEEGMQSPVVATDSYNMWCGPRALYIALKAMGCEITFEQCVEGSDSKEGSSTLAGLLRCATAMGVRASAVQVDSVLRLCKQRSMAIVQVLTGPERDEVEVSVDPSRRAHFVLVVRVERDMVRVSDVAHSPELISVPVAQFNSVFTGYALLLQPPEQAAEHKTGVARQ